MTMRRYMLLNLGIVAVAAIAGIPVGCFRAVMWRKCRGVKV